MENIMDERQPQTGDRRFACQCGARFHDGTTALSHCIAGHQTVLERYALGNWNYHPEPISSYLVESLGKRLPGENMEMFVSRIERLAETAEKSMTREDVLRLVN